MLLSTNGDLSRRRSVGLPALKHLPFILFETGFALRRIILDACHRQGFEPDIVARSSQIDFIVELAAAGLGVAFLPQMIAQQRKHASVSRVLLAEPDTDWHIAMVGVAGPICRRLQRRGSMS